MWLNQMGYAAKPLTPICCGEMCCRDASSVVFPSTIEYLYLLVNVEGRNPVYFYLKQMVELVPALNVTPEIRANFLRFCQQRRRVGGCWPQDRTSWAPERPRTRLGRRGEEEHRFHLHRGSLGQLTVFTLLARRQAKFLNSASKAFSTETSGEIEYLQDASRQDGLYSKDTRTQRICEMKSHRRHSIPNSSHHRT